jgi:HK97 gp10 family phage protein
VSQAVIGVTLENAQEFKRQLSRLSAEAREEVVVKAALAGAEPFRAAAVARAPVLKVPDPRRQAGNLKSKVSLWLQKKEPGMAQVQVGINRRDLRVGRWAVFYAGWVEFGTRFMDAIPFLRPAYDSEWRRAADITIGTFQTWLKRWGAQ